MADKRISELISTNIVDPADNFVLQRGATNLRILGSDLIAAIEGTTLGGQPTSTLIQTPTATEDGYAVTWDNTAGEYNLTAVAGGTKIAGQNTDALVQSPTATEDGYVIAWNNSNNEYELIAGGSGGSILSNDSQTLTADKTHTFNNSFKVTFNQQGNFGNNEMLAFNANATGVGTVAKLRFNGGGKSLDIGIGGTAHTSRAGVGFIESSDVLLTKADFNYVQSLFSRVEHSDDGANFSIVNMGGEWDLDPNTGRDQAYFGGLRLPYGTTDNRPSKSPVDGLTALTAAELEGMIRYNSTTNKIEGYELAGGWQDMIGGGGGNTVYSADDALDGNRIVDNGAFSLTFDNNTIANTLAITTDGQTQIVKGMGKASTALTAPTGFVTCNLNNGDYFEYTGIDQAISVQITNPPSTGFDYGFTLELNKDATATTYAITWPGSVVWADGVSLDQLDTASQEAIVSLFTIDGGTTWHASIIATDFS